MFASRVQFFANELVLAEPDSFEQQSLRAELEQQAFILLRSHETLMYGTAVAGEPPILDWDDEPTTNMPQVKAIYSF